MTLAATSLLDVLHCPCCRSRSLRLIARGHAFGEPLPESGMVVCDACGHRYPIAEHILDLGHERSHTEMTVAGRSNLMPLMPHIYEHVWRPRSMSVLTGGQYSVREELEALATWQEARAGGFALDLGTSTGLYARALAAAHAALGNEAPMVIALDLSPQMLRTARRLALRRGLRRIAYVRANAESLPFADDAFRMIVCGGSLNEFRSPRKALEEAQRVLTPAGCFFVMHLTRAKSATGLLAQAAAGRSGIRFPSQRRWEDAYAAAGLSVLRRESHGVVAFNMLGRNPVAQDSR